MRISIPNRLLVAILLALPAFTASAQKKAPTPVRPRVSLGAEFAIPTDKEFSKMFTIGFGGSGKLDVPVTEALYATASAGFISFYTKDEYAGDPVNLDNKSYIPLKAGAKYYINSIFYAQGEVGASVGVQKHSGTALLVSPGVGASFPITKTGFFNTDVRYESWMRDGGNLNNFGLRVAYQF
jgi:hypothetical protein